MTIEITLDEYIKAYEAEPEKYAVISVAMAADHLGITSAAIGQRIKSGQLQGLTIEGNAKNWRVVMLHSLVESIRSKRERNQSIIAKTKKVLTTIAANKSKPTIAYSVLMERVGLNYRNPHDRKLIGELLGQITRESFEQDKLMLSVLAVEKNTGLPTESFFLLAEELGTFDFEEDDYEEFFESQCRKVCRRYGKKRGKQK